MRTIRLASYATSFQCFNSKQQFRLERVWFFFKRTLHVTFIAAVDYAFGSTHLTVETHFYKKNRTSTSFHINLLYITNGNHSKNNTPKNMGCYLYSTIFPSYMRVRTYVRQTQHDAAHAYMHKKAPFPSCFFIYKYGQWYLYYQKGYRVGLLQCTECVYVQRTVVVYTGVHFLFSTSG